MIVWISLAGSLGAVSRFVLDGHLRARFDHNFPWATIIINMSGSFLLGLMTGLLFKHHGLASWGTIAGTGFCGGYTTFSTASFESVRLLEERRYLAALWNTFGVLASTILFASSGIALAQRI